MHRGSRGWGIRIPERAANSTELKPASRKTKEAWSRRSLEGLQMAQQRRRSEFKTSLELSNHRSLLHPSRLYNCCSPRILVLDHTNRAPHQTESTYQQKRHPYKALTKVDGLREFDRARIGEKIDIGQESLVRRQWQNEASAVRQCVEPQIGRSCDASVDVNNIGVFARLD
jgi:hypothetical protein